jgi:hypothetical protein
MRANDFEFNKLFEIAGAPREIEPYSVLREQVVSSRNVGISVGMRALNIYLSI